MRRRITLVIASLAIGAGIALGANWFVDRDSGAKLSADDAKIIASASLSPWGAERECDLADFKANGVWMVSCRVTTHTQGPCVEYSVFGTAAGCVRHEDKQTESRYLILVDDDTGKLIDYSP